MPHHFAWDQSFLDSQGISLLGITDPYGHGIERHSFWNEQFPEIVNPRVIPAMGIPSWSETQEFFQEFGYVVYNVAIWSIPVGRVFGPLAKKYGPVLAALCAKNPVCQEVFRRIGGSAFAYWAERTGILKGLDRMGIRYNRPGGRTSGGRSPYRPEARSRFGMKPGPQKGAKPQPKPTASQLRKYGIHGQSARSSSVGLLKTSYKYKDVKPFIDAGISLLEQINKKALKNLFEGMARNLLREFKNGEEDMAWFRRRGHCRLV